MIPGGYCMCEPSGVEQGGGGWVRRHVGLAHVLSGMSYLK